MKVYCSILSSRVIFNAFSAWAIPISHWARSLCGLGLRILRNKDKQLITLKILPCIALKKQSWPSLNLSDRRFKLSIYRVFLKGGQWLPCSAYKQTLQQDHMTITIKSVCPKLQLNWRQQAIFKPVMRQRIILIYLFKSSILFYKLFSFQINILMSINTDWSSPSPQ